MKYSRPLLRLVLIFTLVLGAWSCKERKMNENPINKNKSAAEFLGHPEYRAISYGGYRTLTREDQPSLSQIKEDLKILSALGIKVIRTYNLQLDQAPNILKAIRALKSEESGFEMYVMLGAWIDCQGAWTQSQPNHDIGAKGRKEGDLKEFWHFGQYVQDNPELEAEYHENVEVRELAEFNKVGKETYKMLEKTATYVLRALSLHLGLDEFYFDNYVHNGNSILRPIHYPPIHEEPKNAERAAAHGDINRITLLMGLKEKDYRFKTLMAIGLMPLQIQMN